MGPKGARRWVPVPEAVTLRYVQEICQVRAFGRHVISSTSEDDSQPPARDRPDLLHMC